MIRRTSIPAMAPASLGGLPLGVVEVGWNGDDRLANLLAQLGLGVLLDFLEDEGRNLGRREALAGHLNVGILVGPGHYLVRGVC